jgi:hypothetical protein
MIMSLMFATAFAQEECFPGAETEAFGVEIEVKDSGLGGLDVEMELDGASWELPGQLSRALDWSLIEDWGTPACVEDSDCFLRVTFILGRLSTASVDKSGDPWTLIEIECE